MYLVPAGKTSLKDSPTIFWSWANYTNFYEQVMIGSAINFVLYFLFLLKPINFSWLLFPIFIILILSRFCWILFYIFYFFLQLRFFILIIFLFVLNDKLFQQAANIFYHSLADKINTFLFFNQFLYSLLLRSNFFHDRRLYEVRRLRRAGLHTKRKIYWLYKIYDYRFISKFC